MKKITIITFLLATFLSSCKQADPNKQIDEGQVNQNVYTSDAIGWTINIPEGWKIMAKDKLQDLTEKGNNAIQKTGADIDYSGLKYLINFQKDQFNIFQSSIEPMPGATQEDWHNNNLYLKELLYSTFQSQGIKVDTSSSKKTVDKVEFEVFNVKVYSSEGKLILNQMMHSAFIDGFDFGVIINYNNEIHKKELLNAFENSKLSKK